MNRPKRQPAKSKRIPKSGPAKRGSAKFGAPKQEPKRDRKLPTRGAAPRVGIGSKKIAKGAPRRVSPSTPRPSTRAQNLDGRQVEGRQAVRELLLAGTRRVIDVWIAEDIEQSAVIGDITELATEMKVSIKRVTRAALEAEARSDAPQGVLAHAAPIEPVDFDTLCTRTALNGSPPFLIALDGVTDPQNLGALMRSAACAGVTGVVLPRHRAAHVTPTVTKASAGAVEHLPMTLVSGLPAAMTVAKDLGVWIVGLDADGEVNLFDLPVGNDPVMLVLGAEGKGLGRLTRARCDIVVSIPLWGAISSLNVGVAGALACYEVARHRAGR